MEYSQALAAFFWPSQPLTNRQRLEWAAEFSKLDEIRDSLQESKSDLIDWENLLKERFSLYKNKFGELLLRAKRNADEPIGGPSSKKHKGFSPGVAQIEGPLENLRILSKDEFRDESIPCNQLPSLSTKKKSPKVPLFKLEGNSLDEMASLKKFCYANPIVLVQNASNALNFDLKLFSTKALLKNDPTAKIQVNYQKFQRSEFNKKTKGKHGWKYNYKKKSMTLKKFVEMKNCKLASKGRKDGQVLFGTNFDLSNKKKWSQQIEEVQMKLPEFLRLEDSSNILSCTYTGHEILGMNTLQAFLKEKGSRTAAHQENGNLCSVNMNVGAEDTEWYAVDQVYWKNIEDLCKKYGAQFQESWWPNLKDLTDSGIPVYRFKQKMGEIVFINIGCVHWVQASGKCNNIAWNVGLINSKQFHAIMKRFEWNRFNHTQTILPVIGLAWRLAEFASLTETRLFNMIKSILEKTLGHSKILIEYQKAKGLRALNRKIHKEEEENNQTPYCSNWKCKIELYGMYFVEYRKQKRRHSLHPFCIECMEQIEWMGRKWKGREFYLFKDVEMDKLEEIFSNFMEKKIQME